MSGDILRQLAPDSDIDEILMKSMEDTMDEFVEKIHEKNVKKIINKVLGVSFEIFFFFFIKP